MSIVAVAALVWAIQPVDEPLQWQAPPDCPGADDVRARARRLARDPATPLPGVAVVDRAGEGRWTLRLRIGDVTREHAAASCEALADLTALAVAVAADPVAVASTVRASSPAPMTPVAPRIETPPPPRRIASVEAPARRSHRPRWTTALGVAAVAGVAELPRVDAGPSLSFALERAALSLQLRGMWLAEQRTAIPGLERALARLQAANASLRACGQWRQRAIGLLGCGGVELGALVGAPQAVARIERRAALWVAVLAAVGLRGWVHPRVALELGADLVLGLRRPQFALADAPERTVAAGQGGVRGWAGILVRLSRPR